MLFRQLIDGPSSTFTYVLADPATRQAVIVDPVFEQHARDSALLRELGLELRFSLDTHVHADHVTGAWLMKRALGSRIAVAARSGAEGADLRLTDGDMVECGNLRLSVRETPGHTNGCLTFVLDDQGMVFTGDCLLIRSAGRTDFQQGDPKQMFRSIRERIFSLPDDHAIYPAHDYLGRTASTVGEERAFNPRVGGRASEEDFVGYLRNLALPHPNHIDVAVPANLRCGRPENDEVPRPAAWGPVVQTYAGVLEIDPEWVAGNREIVHVLDVRTEAEFDGELGRIEGAQLIPIDDLRRRMSEVPRTKPVVTVCRSGRRSAQATVLLREAGVREVANLAGGMLRWRDLSLPETPSSP